MNINDIIIKPIITEKTAKQMQLNQYVFLVNPKATKPDIKRAIEFIFSRSNALVEKVRIINVKPHATKKGNYEGYTKRYKKAIVFLKEGSVPIYGSEGVDTKSDDKDTKSKKGLKIIDTDKLYKAAEEEER